MFVACVFLIWYYYIFVVILYFLERLQLQQQTFDPNFSKLSSLCSAQIIFNQVIVRVGFLQVLISFLFVSIIVPLLDATFCCAGRLKKV